MSQYWTKWHERNIRRRRVLSGAAGLSLGAGALALVGCGDDDDGPAATATSGSTPGSDSTPQATADASAPKPGGNLIIYDAIGSDVFDPAITIHAGSLFLGVVQVYDYLNRLVEGYALESHMAELPEQVDETTIIYTVKPGITWQDRPPLDGRPFTAEDAVFGLQRFREPNPEFTFGSRFELVDNLEVVDDLTFRLTTSEPFAPLLPNVAEENMVMVSREAVDTFGDDGLKVFENMVGTGAWMPGDFEQSVRSTLVRNPNYWQQGKPYLDSMETIQITDNAQKEAALVSGQVDMSAGWGGIETRQFAENIKSQLGDDIIVAEKPIVARQTLHFNATRPPFDDPRVRRALYLAADRQAMWAAIQFNHLLMGVIAPQVTPYGFSEDYLSTLPGYREDKEEDLTEARALLESADLGDGFDFDMIGSGPANEVLQANWSELGIGVTLQPLTVGEWSAARTAGNFDVISVSNTSAADPDFELYGGCHTDGTANFGRFSDPDVDRLAEQQRQIFDAEERKAVTDELQLKLFELAPQIWSFAYLRWNIYRPHVKGWRVIPALEGWPYADVWLDQ